MGRSSRLPIFPIPLTPTTSSSTSPKHPYFLEFIRRTHRSLKPTTFTILFIISKEYTQKQVHRVESWTEKGPTVTLLSHQEYFTSWHQCVKRHIEDIAQPRGSPKLWCLEFLLRFHYVDRINEIFINMVKLNIQPHSRSGG